MVGVVTLMNITRIAGMKLMSRIKKTIGNLKQPLNVPEEGQDLGPDPGLAQTAPPTDHAGSLEQGQDPDQGQTGKKRGKKGQGTNTNMEHVRSSYHLIMTRKLLRNTT